MVALLLVSAVAGTAWYLGNDEPSACAGSVWINPVESPPENATVSDAERVTDSTILRLLLEDAARGQDSVAVVTGAEMETVRSELGEVPAYDPHAEWYVRYQNETMYIRRTCNL